MNCFLEWRRWLRPISLTVYLVMVLIALPLLIVEFQVNSVEKHLQAWFIGGLFVLLAVPISIWGIVQHLIHYTNPQLQRYIVRILWMVPIYAVDAWFALRFKEAAIYLDTIRECYEAYVLYNFMAYLLCYLNTEFPDLGEILEAKPPVKHLFPFCWFPPWKSRNLISWCKHGALQYTVVRPVTTVIALITQSTGVYHEGKFAVGSAWFYLTGINSLSQALAMYCLVLFYKATSTELKPIKPVPKFLCIKAIVFFLFWQSVLIAGLVALGVIKKSDHWPDFSSQDIATGLQDFIICIEMFLFAIAHYYSFSHKPFVDHAQGYQDICASFRAMWDVSDVRADVVDHVRVVGATATEVVIRPLRKRPTGTDTEKTPLLGGGQSEAGSSEQGLTPPVDLEYSADLYTESRGNRPLIDLAADNESRESEVHEVLIVAPEVNEVSHNECKSQDGMPQEGGNQDEGQSENPLVDVGNSLLPTSRQDMKPREDSVSIQTFESVSDITGSSFQRPHTSSSMQNYVQFSDADTSSQTDLLQSSDFESHSQSSRKSGYS